MQLIPRIRKSERGPPAERVALASAEPLTLCVRAETLSIRHALSRRARQTGVLRSGCAPLGRFFRVKAVN
jgi:hypothetical protein